MLKQCPQETGVLAHSIKNLYHFACQGPDFLFYHKYISQWDQRVNIVARRIHRENAADLLLCGVQHVATWKRCGREWQTLACYMLGAISHWAADCTLHPLVYAIVPEGAVTGRSRHKRLESTMDILLMERYGVQRQNRKNILALEDGLPDAVCRYYLDCVRAVWPGGPRINDLDLHRSYKQCLEFMTYTERHNAAYHLTRGLAKVSGGQIRLDLFWFPDHKYEEDVYDLEGGGVYDLEMCIRDRSCCGPR